VNPLAPIVNDHRQSGALNGLVNLCGFIDDNVFLTKSGDLGIVLALDGVDYECLDHHERETITRRFEVALRLLDESMRLSQYVLKRNCVLPPHLPLGDPLVDSLLASRHHYLAAKHASLYTLSLYAVVLAEATSDARTWPSGVRPWLVAPGAFIRDRLSTTRSLLLLDEDLERLRQRLLHKVDAWTKQLHDTVRPRILPKHEAFQFLRRLLNYDPDKANAVGLREDSFVDYHVADSALECHRGHLRLDDYYVRVLTLKEPPAQTFPHIFQALYEIPSNLILMNDWQREGEGAIRREIHAKRRHFHNSRISLINYLPLNPPNGDNPSAPGDLLVDDSAAALVNDLGACLTELAINGRYFGRYTMTIVLYDTDPAALGRSVAACIKAAATHDAQLTDERANLLNAWLAVLPGNSAYNLRSMHLLNTNCADLSLLFAQDTGQAVNRHLGRESLAVLETTQGSPYHLNLHVDDVAHTLVLGATGSGKSFFLNFLIAHLQRYAPRTLIFDLGKSFERLTRYFHGSALRLGLDRHEITINPFSLEPTPANLHFLFGFVKVLVESGGQCSMSLADDRDLYEQLQTLYALEPDERRLSTLANILRRPLAQQLHRWVEGGPYASLFDHLDDTLTLAPFQYIDFEGLDAYPQMLEPLLFYLLHRADATLSNPEFARTLKVFVVDEAWRFLRNPIGRQYVTEALKTWRKKNACVLLATQSSEDLERSEILRVAIESCPTKCFLANPNIDPNVYRELFHLNQTEAGCIETLEPRRQLLLKRPDLSKVLTLSVDPDSARLFSLENSQ
jgi:type IV secretion system protein VirB4